MKLLIANFKSNKNRHEMQEWTTEFSQVSNQQTGITIVLCPPFPFLPLFEKLHSEHTFVGVQDISSYPAGAYTGAVSTYNLIDFNITYAIIGHSERRRYFHETSIEIAQKVRECLAAKITPIVCVTKDEINATANALSEEERTHCIVAFEPIEHIGTGESDTLEHILETKKWVQTAFGSVPYIYGGSVNPSTDSQILTSTDIDGFLVGSASLDPETFLSLVELVR